MPKRLRATLLHIVYSKSHEIAIVFIIFIIKKGRCPTRRIRKVNTLLHTTIPALLKKKRKGGVQRRDSAFCPSSGNLPSRKSLFKIFHTRLEYFNILLSIDINSNSVSTTFAVSHLTKDTSIRTGNALNVHIRTIDIPLLIDTKLSIRSYILCCNLSVCKQFLQPFFICNETSFTM